VRTFVARVFGVHTEERAWRVGAVGEEKVADRLAKLVTKDPRWRVLHAIPVGERGSDIDHLAIGPAGVFTINAKYHAGAKIWVGGDTLRHVSPPSSGQSEDLGGRGHAPGERRARAVRPELAP